MHLSEIFDSISTIRREGEVPVNGLLYELFATPAQTYFGEKMAAKVNHFEIEVMNGKKIVTAVYRDKKKSIGGAVNLDFWSLDESLQDVTYPTLDRPMLMPRDKILLLKDIFSDNDFGVMRRVIHSCTSVSHGKIRPEIEELIEKRVIGEYRLEIEVFDEKTDIAKVVSKGYFIYLCFVKYQKEFFELEIPTH